MNAKILIIDDDHKICSLLSDILKDQDFRVAQAHTTEEGWEQLELVEPDLILLDVEIPIKGGLEFCREVKEKDRYRQIPIIFLTVRDQEVDRVAALNLGGDDFIVKPFRQRELLARIHVALRRAARYESSLSMIRSGTLYVDLDKRVVQVNNRDVHLTPKELELLKLLYINRHKVLSERAIYDQIWGSHCAS
ncbi:MAG: hypothetical protein A2034_00345, partial [Elusimicrobia bacterium GWA2_38_7]